MNKIVFLSLISIFFYKNLTSQEKDYSLAKVATVEQGVYVFINSIPYHPYDVICKWEVYWSKEGDFAAARNEAIKRAKKKYNNVDGIIFKDDKYQEAEFIKFIGKEITGGGFKGGDKIVYKDGRSLQYGEITYLDNTKQKATIKFINEYGEEKIDIVSYEKLSHINKDEYQLNIEKQNTEIQKHKFTIGEKVYWVDSGNLKYGEILLLNNQKHDATVKYLDKFGDTKTEIINYLKIEKADDDKYKEFMLAQNIEIQKHKFEINETVSFIDDGKLRVGEVTALNSSNHKASVKYLNIYGEEKTTDIGYFSLEKISKEKYQEEKEKYQLEISKHKFKIGDNVNWSKSNLIKKAEIIQCEVLSLDDLNHKALVKYRDKDNKEVQAKVDYLELTK